MAKRRKRSDGKPRLVVESGGMGINTRVYVQRGRIKIPLELSAIRIEITAGGHAAVHMTGWADQVSVEVPTSDDAAAQIAEHYAIPEEPPTN